MSHSVSPLEPAVPEALVARCLERARAIHRVPEDAFARAVAETSRIYTRARGDIERQAGAKFALAARLGFFLPRDLLKVWGPLAALGRMGGLPGGSTWRVLDLGAGLGATSLGAALFAARTGAARALDVVAVDRDAEALRELALLARDAGDLGLAPVTVETRAADLFAPSSWRGGPFDLVLLGLALNEREGDDPEPAAALLRALAKELAPGGAIVVVEPALRETTRALQRTRDVLAASGPPYVAFPCPHALPCPMLPNERDWCHQELAVELPPALAKVAAAAGLRDERLTYAALVLRNEPGAEVDAGALRLVSAPLVTKGKVEAIACAPEGRLVRLMRLDRHRSPANAALGDAVRGEPLVVEGGAEDGARVRVGPEARVTRLAGPPPHG